MIIGAPGALRGWHGRQGAAGRGVGARPPRRAWTSLPGPRAATNPPSMMLTAPSDGTTVKTGSPVALSATAADGDGSVTKVAPPI